VKRGSDLLILLQQRQSQKIAAFGSSYMGVCSQKNLVGCQAAIAGKPHKFVVIRKRYENTFIDTKTV
jgi:hypothetical protein